MSDEIPTTTPEAVFRAHGSQMRMSEAMAAGLSRYQLYHLRDEGVIEPISHGLYRLADLPPITNPELVAVASRSPRPRSALSPRWLGTASLREFPITFTWQCRAMPACPSCGKPGHPLIHQSGATINRGQPKRRGLPRTSILLALGSAILAKFHSMESY